MAGRYHRGYQVTGNIHPVTFHLSFLHHDDVVAIAGIQDSGAHPEEPTTHKHGPVNWFMVAERTPTTRAEVHQCPMMNVPTAAGMPEPVLGHKFIRITDRASTRTFGSAGICETRCSLGNAAETVASMCQ